MAIQPRQRHGRSLERVVANGHMDFQAAVMDQLDGLAAQRADTGRGESLRRLYVARLAAVRAVQRCWQRDVLEPAIHQAEGYAAQRAA